jgi:cytochrome b561
MPSPFWWRCWAGPIPARARRTIRAGSGCFTSHVPQITSPDKAAADAYEERHIFFAYVLLALIVLHLAAALWHHFIKRDRVTARMVDGAAG